MSVSISVNCYIFSVKISISGLDLKLKGKMAINKPQVKKVVEKVGGAYGRDST